MKLSAKTLAKRWLIFLAVWLIVFAFAPLRQLAHVQWQHTLWPLSALAGAGGEKISYTELAAQHPREASVWAQAAGEYWLSQPQPDPEDDASRAATAASQKLFPGEREKDQHAEERRRLDITIEKFPDQPWLIAKRLNNSWGYIFGERTGGELADINLAANKAAGIPSPERREVGSYQMNLKPAELQRILELCVRGQKLEPQNAYYDWTRTYFLALAWRDKEAWRALDTAARKPTFNDHQLEALRAQLGARAILLNRPLLWEEKLMMAYATLFPQLARYREFARIVSWQSIKAQRRGDHALALRLIGSFAKVSAKMRDDSKFVIERLVAIAMESIVVMGATYDARSGVSPPAWRKGTTAQMFRARIGSASDYAIAHGRRDLADWLARDAAKAAAVRTSLPLLGAAGTSFQDAVFILLLRTLGTMLLTTLPLCFLAWLLAGWIFKAALFQKRLHWNMPVLFESEKIAPRDVAHASLACGGLNFIGYAALGVLVAALTFSFIALGLGQLGALQNSISQYFVNAQGAPDVWESLFYSLLNGENLFRGIFGDDAYHSYAQWVLALLPLAVSALWCMKVAVARQKKWQAISAGEAPPARMGVLPSTRALLQEYLGRPAPAQRELTPRTDLNAVALASSAFRNLLFGAFWVSWLLTAFWPGQRQEALAFYAPLFGALLLGGGLWLDLFLRWKKRRGAFNHRRRAARFGLRLMRESWLGWLALGSVLFLLTLLVALPLRSRADAQIARYLTRGEVAMRK
jgi:hypothetical protein